MISSISNNISALNAFSNKLGVTSNNIANWDSENFKKSRAVILEGENGDVTTDISKVGSTLGAKSSAPVEDTSEKAPSNVDLTEEIPQMIISQRGYEANIKAIQTREEMLGSVLDIIG